MAEFVKLPRPLLRALKVFATMKSETVSKETGFVLETCQQAIHTAWEYSLTGRIRIDDE